jgi:hypothetical protein
VIGTLHRQRPLHAGLYLRERVPFLTKVFKKTRDDLFECEAGVEWFIVTFANIHSASLAKLNPSASRQLAICGADCVCVYVVTPREVARAWQAVADLQVVADNAEDDLRYQLLANRDFTVF